MKKKLNACKFCLHTYKFACTYLNIYRYMKFVANKNQMFILLYYNLKSKTSLLSVLINFE